MVFENRLYISQPTFPLQEVPTDPRVTFKYAATEGFKTGYINPSKPHAANHILVGNLGEEEILLLACDDGDVVGYTTRSLFDFYQRRTHHPKPPKPFFLQNVGASAWGLAIHTSGRLIAVSSNTQQILVFSFALVQAHDPHFHHAHCSLRPKFRFGDSFCSDVAASNLRNPVQLGTCTYTRNADRHHDLVWGLAKHESNIPNIAFWNNPTSDGSTYLTSIDIDGQFKIWDVLNAEKVNEFDLKLNRSCKSLPP